MSVSETFMPGNILWAKLHFVSFLTKIGHSFITIKSKNRQNFAEFFTESFIE